MLLNLAMQLVRHQLAFPRGCLCLSASDRRMAPSFHYTLKRGFPMSSESQGETDYRPSCSIEKWIARASDLPANRINIADIGASYTPRDQEVRDSHVKLLAQSPTVPPPIAVHRATMRVIDGVHRIHAARARGDSDIDAIFFEGSEADAYVLAVRLNVHHGLPLTLAERKGAARRLLASNPGWSDRAIAEIAGLSHKTVGKLRSCATGQQSQLHQNRLGRDGKQRPVGASVGRRKAAAYLESHPDAALREIARASGVSVGTARDVRDRVRRGESPTLASATPLAPPATARPGSNHDSLVEENSNRLPSGGAETSASIVRLSADAPRLLRRLQNDPSLKFSEKGRTALRALSACVLAVAACQGFDAELPLHCASALADLSLKNAMAWRELEKKFRLAADFDDSTDARTVG